MSIKRKLKRQHENKLVRFQIDELLKALGMSKTEFKKMGIRVSGEGLKYEAVSFGQSGYKLLHDEKSGKRKLIFENAGHKPGMRSQFSLLLDTYKDKLEDEELLKEIKQKLDEKKDMEKKNENQG